MTATILVTGFGPFPGAPFNPTGTLVKSLGRLVTPRGTRVIPHVFQTSYASVDRELPALLRKYRPVALLMFGLAAQTPYLRIETRARNIHSQLADVDGVVRATHAIAPGRTETRPLPTLARRLFGSARVARVPAVISNDAGEYLCNYLCWQAAKAARKPGGPLVAAFIHVPEGSNAAHLLRAGRAFLGTIAAACR